MNNKKKALGRGLSALLSNPDTDITTSSTEKAQPVAGSIATIKVDQIETNPFQPRTHFEEQALQELADSIKIHGIIQPVTVRKVGYDKYQLISGERRFRASQIAGLSEIPVYIRIANDQSMLEMALLENIQRENLDAIEVAISYKRLIDECNLTQEELSEKMSKQRSTVTNYLRLLKLPAEIQLGIREGKITMGHARTLINVEDEKDQLALYNEMLNHRLSVRDAEALVRAHQNLVQEKQGSTKTRTTSTPTLQNLSFEQQKMVNDLKSIFSSDIELKRNSKGKGKLIISFNNDDQLDKITEIFNLIRD